ncbi:MAG: hypothetical protein J6A49_02735 [Clostridia bacterium]|nr:hypothetical protein [Clostridia bacterium]
MVNETRDRLADLLKKADENCERKCITDYEDAILDNADYLIENGVLCPPCKVGDTVYFVCEDDEGDFISKNKVTDVCTQGFFVSCYDPPQDDMGGFEYYKEIGKTVFFTKEQAEQKLKEMRGDES